MKKKKIKIKKPLTLRERSGNVSINSKLVSFLYELMRDHVLPGDVERLTLDAMNQPVLYTNGYLAKYAEDIAARLTKR